MVKSAYILIYTYKNLQRREEILSSVFCKDLEKLLYGKQVKIAEMCECIDWLLEAEMNNIMQFAAHWYILSTQKLPARKCKECGKKLSWNYRYGICNACYNARRMSYENGWYDSWY